MSSALFTDDLRQNTLFTKNIVTPIASSATNVTVIGTAIDTSLSTRQISSYTILLMSIFECYLEVVKSENRKSKKYSFSVRYLVTAKKCYIFIVGY